MIYHKLIVGYIFIHPNRNLIFLLGIYRKFLGDICRVFFLQSFCREGREVREAGTEFGNLHHFRVNVENVSAKNILKSLCNCI